jgi:hypothetical protein
MQVSKLEPKWLRNIIIDIIINTVRYVLTSILVITFFFNRSNTNENNVQTTTAKKARETTNESKVSIVQIVLIILSHAEANPPNMVFYGSYDMEAQVDIVAYQKL